MWVRRRLRRAALHESSPDWCALRENRSARSQRYPWAKRVAMWSGQHPIRSIVTVTLLYAAVILESQYGLLSNALDLAAGANADTNARIGFRDFWTVNIALLGVQGALIGLVFPLVIAFVGLLNQGRAAFSSRLTIYIEATAALFVGLSSLLLCVALALQLPFAAQLETSGGAVVTALNLAWFVINVAALAYFILRTIAFLHPARRAPLIRAYIANVTWPAELTRIVTHNRWGNAIAYGYLPDGDEAEMFDEGRKARVWYSSFWYAGEPRVKRRLRKSKRLVDIRLAMLAPIIADWLKQARDGEGSGTHDISIPLEPGRDYDGEAVLALPGTSSHSAFATSWVSTGTGSNRKVHRTASAALSGRSAVRPSSPAITVSSSGQRRSQTGDPGKRIPHQPPCPRLRRSRPSSASQCLPGPPTGEAST